MDFLVKRDNLREYRLDDRAPMTGDDLAEGDALLRVDSFALTANNITYAVAGDMMSYWNFFPGPDGWGRIPVWGFADVEASKVEGLVVGDRIYGYLPMSSQLVVTPDQVKPSGFTDAAAHRAMLPAVYNQYERVANSPGYAAERVAAQSVLRPLVTTSFLIDDFLADNDFFGATTVYLSSASSKTSLGLAYLLSSQQRCDAVGLTSAANAPFVESVGYYDRVVIYGSLADDSAAGGPTGGAVFVDMAGDGAVVAEVHHQLGQRLRYSCQVGATHWEDLVPQPDLPGPAPELFFAPSQVEKRRSDWGPGGFEQRFAGAWSGYLGSVDTWLEITRGVGAESVTDTYVEVLEGRTKPQQGHVLSL